MPRQHTGNVQPTTSAEEHETVGGITGKGAKRMVPVPLTTLIDYDANNNPIYIGKALQGSSNVAAVWQIKKITYNASNNPTAIQFADGSDEFNFVWDERASYSYS